MTIKQGTTALDIGYMTTKEVRLATLGPSIADQTVRMATTYLQSMEQTLDELEKLPGMARLKAIRLAAFMIISDPAMRDNAIRACIQAGLSTYSPTETFATDVDRLLREAVHGA